MDGLPVLHRIGEAHSIGAFPPRVEEHRCRSLLEMRHQWRLGPLRVRGIEKVARHADICILARLSVALARARAVSLAA